MNLYTFDNFRAFKLILTSSYCNNIFIVCVSNSFILFVFLGLVL